jgi:site-specific DNA-adenine methylase
VRTATPSSPADGALRRAAAFLRVVQPDPEAAELPRTARPSRSDGGPIGRDDGRQMQLPNVALDAPVAGPGQAVTAEPSRGEGVEAVEKTIWGSPAGKKHLAPRLVKLIPPHKTYVEPFAGSGAVFFAKSPSDKEILGDADPEIAFAYKALSTLSDGDLAALKKKDWTGRRTLYRAMQEAKPKSKVDKLYRFLYLSHFAYGKLRGKSYNPNAEGIGARTIDRIEKYRDRLRNVTVRSAHYADVVKEFDGKDTFFFLDPPYPGHNVEVGEDRFDEVEFRKILDGIKGKFLVTYGTRGKLDTSGFQVRTVRTRRTISSMRGVGGPKTLPQLLIANYAITKKSLGPYELDEVEASFELPADVAADLDLACVLAKALASEVGEPLIVALANALDRFDGASEERAMALARKLLPLSARIAPAIETAIPDVVAALEAATPAIGELAKVQWSRAYINDLPDDAFLYIEPGGARDDDGKTAPRSLRHFPYRNQTGDLDVPHLQNAIDRIPQSTVEGLTADAKAKLQDRARRLIEEAQAAVAKAGDSNAAQAPLATMLVSVLEKRIPLLKTGEERYVLGVVLEPETVDAQDDIYSAAEVRDAAHRFMEQHQNIGLMHRGLVNGRVKILESYLAPTSFPLDGAQVRKGTWLLAVRILDDELWAQIKSGELTGLSIGGSARRD